MSADTQRITTELATKTAKSASFIISGKSLSIIIQVLMFIVVARLLLPTGYGIYTIALSIAGLISAFGGLNIGVYFNEHIPYLISKRRSNEIGMALGDGLTAVIIPGLVFFLIGAAASGFLSSYVLHSSAYTFIVLLAMSSIVFSFVYSTINTILIGFHDGKNSGIGLIIYSIAQLVLSITFIELATSPEGKITGAISGYILALLIASVYQIIIAHRHSRILFVRKGMRKRMMEILRFSMPLTYTNIVSTLVTNFSVIILGIVILPAVVGQAAVGYYGVASRVGTLIDVVAGSIGVVLIPTFAEAINSRKIRHKVGRFFYYSVYFGLLFTTPMVAYVTVFSYSLITTLFSASYAGATFYMQLIGVGLLLGIFGSFATQLMISAKRTNKVFKYSLIVGIIELVSLLVLVPLLNIVLPKGGEGAVIGVIIAMLYVGGMATNILFVNYLKELKVTIKLAQPMKVILANIILAILISLIFLVTANQELILAAGFVLTLLIYPPILAKIGAVTEDDIKLITEIGGDLPIVSQALRALLSYTMFFI